MRRLMWFAIGFALSCGLGVWALPGGCIIPLAVLTGLAALLVRKRIPRAAVVCVGCCLGLVWYLAFQRYYLPPAHAMDGTKIQTTVTATGYSYETDYGLGVDGEFTLEEKTYKVRLYVNESRQIQPGDTITGSFQLRYTAPGGMRDPTYHAGDRILFLGYQRGSVQIRRTLEKEAAYLGAELAYGIVNRLEASFPEDVSAFVKALLLGEDSDLSYEADTALKISGIRHIIAVSGLHVAVLYTLLRTLTLNKRYLTALLGMPVLILFAAVAGFTPSVSRACIMVGLMMLSRLFEREYDPPTALSFAALVMLMWNPLIITSVSFQMSVACVAGILLFNEPIAAWLKNKLGMPKGKSLRARLKRWFISSVSVTLSATSLTTPMSAYYFGTVSLVGPLTNLLTLWIIQWIFIGVVAACLLSLVSMGAASALGWCLAWPVRYVLTVSKFLASFPLAAVYTKSGYIVAWLVFVYILLAVFLLSRKRYPLVLSCCAVLGLCAALLCSWIEPLLDEVRLTALDVGQGQCLVLQHEGRTFLIDCGGSNDEIAANMAAETLLSQGITRVDGIILTHGDRDHAGAVSFLLTRIDAGFIMVPCTSDETTLNMLSSCTDGQVIAVKEDLKLTIGTSEMTVFGPTFAAEANENSLCILFESENCAILVTGDRGREGELLLMRQGLLPQVDLLIAGHHGSKYSTSSELLETVRPEVVIISVGENNAYGHPAPETLDRLGQFGCRVYRTDEQGTILFRR